VIVGEEEFLPVIWDGVDISQRNAGLLTVESYSRGGLLASAQPTGINAAGVIVGVEYDWVVGWAALGNKLQRAVLWEGNSGPYDLGTLGGKQSSANGINAEGDIAGQAQTASGAWHAVLWTHKHFKATDLNLEINESMAKQVTLTSAVDTNDRCMVLANGVDNETGAQESHLRGHPTFSRFAR
jgi:uncharacterized membrane protein